ncbi:MAG TPA: pseudouridine synthase, partial [Fimbriimonadaceae bacterium]|nr:pseudouridine synthase [Fimbriimonadaceae bacterium]
DAAHRRLAEQIKSKSAERIYVVVVFGMPEHEKFTIDAPIGRHRGIPSLMTVKREGRGAVTHVKVLGSGGHGSLVTCRLETGRTHQIRVHLSSIGHPVRGDKQYAKKPWNEGPLQLHAALLKFVHPATGEALAVYAEPPEDFLLADDVTREGIEEW